MVTSAVTVQDIIPIVLQRPNAKKVDPDTVLPYVLVPVLLLVSTLSFIITCIVMVAIVMGALYVYSRPRQKNRSPFFYSWTKSSIIYMWILFEVEVRGFLEITAMEHAIFLALLACTIYYFYRMKAVSDFELATGSSKGKEYSLVITGDCHYCPICQLEVKDRYFHSIWWDCCVIQQNYVYFLSGMLVAFVTILYGVNLGLTTICHSFLFMGNVLIPTDCSDAYSDFHRAFAFVGCIYGMGYLGVILLVLLKQIFSHVPHYAGLKLKKFKTALTV